MFLLHICSALYGKIQYISNLESNQQTHFIKSHSKCCSLKINVKSQNERSICRRTYRRSAVTQWIMTIKLPSTYYFFVVLHSNTELSKTGKWDGVSELQACSARRQLDLLHESWVDSVKIFYILFAKGRFAGNACSQEWIWIEAWVLTT